MTELPQFLNKASFIFDGDHPLFWIAGGSLLSMLKGLKVNDYDLFAPAPNEVISWLQSKELKKTFENDWVANFRWGKQKIQVIKKYVFESMEQTISSFDFTCISAAFDGKNFICHERFYLDAAQSRVVINKLTLPLSSLKRALKYASRGYAVCPKALAAICKAINELQIDWDNPDQNAIEFYPDGTPSFRGID